MPGRWPSPDPNSWANPRGRKKGKGTTTRARQARRAASPKVLAKKEQRKAEAAAAEAAASAGTAAAASADPLQQGEKDTPAAAAAAAEPLQQGGQDKAAAAAAAAAAAEPLQQGEKDKAAAAAAAAAEPLQQGEKDTAAAKPEPLQQEEKKEKEEEWETALGKRARSVQRSKASKERKQWQVKENPLPEGKPAEPLQEGKKKEKGRPASSAAGRRKLGGGYVGIGSSSSNSTLPSPSPSSASNQPLRQGGQGGTPATPREKGYLSGGKGKPLGQGQKKLDLQPKKKVLGLDWHNVFQIQEGWKDVVPDKHIAKVWDLQAEGWEVHLISFCGQKRAQEVEDWARSLPIKWASVRCIRERCGPWGKAAWCKYLGCTVIMDDNKSILEEALQEGIDVLPVTTWHEKHLWYWGKPFDSFPEAVDHLIMMDGHYGHG